MCKNHKHSSTPITDKESQIMSELPFTIATKNKIPRNTTNKVCEGLFKENYKSLFKKMRGHKQMETHSILMDMKNKYRENGHTAQSNL